MSKHYVNEVGTDFVLDCGVDITSSGEEFIKYKKPSGLVGTWTAATYSSYSALAKVTGTYLIKRTLISSDFDESGLWKFQAYVGAADGTWWGETLELNIYGVFE